MNPQEKRDRIPNHTAALMVALAFVYDPIQGSFIVAPIAGWLLGSVISLFSFLHYYLWFKFQEVELSDSVKKWATFFFLRALDMIPLFGQIFPGIVLSTILTIIMVKAEDALYNHKINLELTNSKKIKNRDRDDGNYKVPKFVRTFIPDINDIMEEELAMESYRGNSRSFPPLNIKNTTGISPPLKIANFKKNT